MQTATRIGVKTANPDDDQIENFQHAAVFLPSLIVEAPDYDAYPEWLVIERGFAGIDMVIASGETISDTEEAMWRLECQSGFMHSVWIAHNPTFRRPWILTCDGEEWEG